MSNPLFKIGIYDNPDQMYSPVYEGIRQPGKKVNGSLAQSIANGSEAEKLDWLLRVAVPKNILIQKNDQGYFNNLPLNTKDKNKESYFKFLYQELLIDKVLYFLNQEAKNLLDQNKELIAQSYHKKLQANPQYVRIIIDSLNYQWKYNKSTFPKLVSDQEQSLLVNLNSGQELNADDRNVYMVVKSILAFTVKHGFQFDRPAEDLSLILDSYLASKGQKPARILERKYDTYRTPEENDQYAALFLNAERKMLGVLERELSEKEREKLNDKLSEKLSAVAGKGRVYNKHLGYALITANTDYNSIANGHFLAFLYRSKNAGNFLTQFQFKKSPEVYEVDEFGDTTGAAFAHLNMLFNLGYSRPIFIKEKHTLTPQIDLDLQMLGDVDKIVEEFDFGLNLSLQHVCQFNDKIALRSLVNVQNPLDPASLENFKTRNFMLEAAVSPEIKWNLSPKYYLKMAPAIIVQYFPYNSPKSNGLIGLRIADDTIFSAGYYFSVIDKRSIITANLAPKKVPLTIFNRLDIGKGQVTNITGLGGKF